MRSAGGWGVVAALLLAGAMACVGEERAGGGSGEVRAGGWSAERIDSLVSAMPALRAEHHVPGVAIALTSGARVQWAAGFGEVEPGGSAVTPGTVFQVASLGKPVFAHLLERLASSRPWSLDDTLGAWSSLDRSPPVATSLTAEALLSHSSGLRYDEVRDRLVVDREGRGRWSYSGAGYALLQRALERAEGRGLEALSRPVLFEPLGLGTMTWVEPPGGPAVRGHDRAGRPLADREVSQSNAASSLRSSVRDYARFLIGAAGVADDPAPDSWTRMTRPRVTVRDDLGLLWGLGWALEVGPSGDVTAFHWGSNPGFKSFAMLDRSRGLGLVVLTNGDDGLELAERVVRLLDPVPHPLFRFYMLHPDD